VLTQFSRVKRHSAKFQQRYEKEAQTTVAGHEVKMLAFYGSHEDLEGAPTEGTVIPRVPKY
jgi:uncharacterized protein (DUF1330 family)